VIIIRDESERVVILSYADYSAVAETGYLLRNPVIAKRLRESLKA
jgi:PHD/YefM family antitoxin component YafN of YafNO toxin-antitoxin module